MSGLASGSESGGAHRRRRNDDADDIHKLKHPNPKKDDPSSDDAVDVTGRHVRPRLGKKEGHGGDCVAASGSICTVSDIREHGLLRAGDLSPELQKIFEKLMDGSDEVDPPEMEEYRCNIRNKLSNRFYNLGGDEYEGAVAQYEQDNLNKRFIEDYENDFSNNLSTFLSSLKKQVTKHPILTRVVNDDDCPLVVCVFHYWELDLEYSYGENLYEETAGPMKDAVTFLIEKNPQVLHYSTIHSSYFIAELIKSKGMTNGVATRKIVEISTGFGV